MRIAAHNVVATFDGPAEARAALVALERKGVEAGDIELFGPGMSMAEVPVTNDEQREADLDALHEVEKRGVIGIGIGVVVGALIGGGIAALMGGGFAVVVGSAIAAALLLGALGFLWAGFSGLSVNEQWEETFESTGGETSVAVHSDDEHEVEVALEALRHAKARRLARCGADGQLREVA
jgi:hypothetical protein